MKQKMYLFLMLAAALFAACSDDDDDKPKAPSTISFEDYSTLVGASYSEMIRQYPEPVMAFGDFYAYENLTPNVEGLTIAINPESQSVYLVMEMLKADAYKEADIDAYFKSKFNFYGVESMDNYDEDGNVVGTTNTYNYGNTEDQAEATLLITLTGNTSVTYINPMNVPVESGGGSSLEEIDPITAVASFLLGEVATIEEEYPDVFSQLNGMYMTFMEENPYLMGVAFTAVDGFVDSVILLYNEDLTTEDIISYYTEEGYTCTLTGTDEEGFEVYTFTNGMISIEYSEGRGVATFVGELD
ncbi:MAG: hypothetical protein IJ013_05700 [Bacteroidaceae bacterium]|nr:hypothetical protein [Bacteroidaceae bacterium]